MLYTFEELDIKGKGLHELISSMGVKPVGKGVVEYAQVPQVVNLYKTGDRTVAVGIGSVGNGFSGYVEDVVEVDTYKLDEVDGSAFKAWSNTIEGNHVLYIDTSGIVLPHIPELKVSQVLKSTCVWYKKDNVVEGVLLLMTDAGEEAWEIHPNYADLYK